MLLFFVNGLPLGAIELKNPSDENATIKDAFNQFQAYRTLAKIIPFRFLSIAIAPLCRKPGFWPFCNLSLFPNRLLSCG
jgi:hypothetical protein